MSYDGKFSCESSLKRLLARCSGLRSDRKLLALSQKVGAVTAEDIAEAIAEPFLHPNYTIPIVGCFRPLCRLIVDRAVTKLGSVPSLISMSDEESDDIGEDDTRVIDFYMERGRGLRLHEMASLALCRALDLAPFFLRCIINYFRFSPQPFARLELVGFDSQITDKGEKHLLDVIRLTYRFLIMEPQIFSGLWDWTCFLDLMQQTSNVGASLAPRRLINILDIRWCGIQILSTSLKISDRATEDFGLGSDEAFACLLRFEEFCQDTSLEKAGFYLQLVEEDQERFSVGIDNFSQFFDFDYHSLVSSTNLLKIESGIKDVRHKVLRVVPGKPFVMTSTIRRSFEMILMAVGQRWPILLHGPAGSGKTAIINMLAEISGNQVLFIHMADEMDSKMLIGNYVCSNQPGEFRWHPGSLTQAISKGYWVVFEDIDKASIEVQSIILPLLEGSNIFVTGRGEDLANLIGFSFLIIYVDVIQLEFTINYQEIWFWCSEVGVEIDVSENFRMFATISTLKHEVSHEIEDTFVIINSHSSNQVGAHACGGSSGAVSRFSLRDLLKWCKRISDLAISVSGFPISVTDCQAIYHEAVETFVAYLPCSPKKLLMMREIAKVWGVPLPETEHDYPPNKPVIQSCRSHLQVGRVALPFTQIPNLPPGRPFVGIRSSLHALERVASSVKYNEPVLLVGETGTGKTTLVQNLAMRLGQQLTVLNLSQQSDIADLLGGYKPADARSICIPLYQEFKELFCRTFSEKENESLLRHLEIYAVEKKWKKLLCACQQSVDYVIQRAPSSCGSKRKRPLTEVLHEWGTFSLRLKAAQKQIGTSSGVYFKFVEGAFITALRNGYWILLDEINLAPPETLQRITGVLDSEKGTLCLAERGDIDYIDRHPSFRLFACMNPATDTGKRELPYSLRSRFTEYFVDDILDENDLTLFVRRYMDEMDPDSGFSNRIVHFYKAAKRESEERLQDGANQKPQFSLRSLARALEYFKTAAKTFGIQKALYDGFCMFFLTLLDCPSAKVMHSMIVSYILGGSLPKDVPFDAYFSSSVGFLDDYVLTRSVKENLKNIARAVYIKKFPVLLQGPTSSGKTSLVHYLASVTGHEFVRINNHEHTDLQEYFGTYITDSQGRLLFQEGVLVKAVRLGYWIVLDELNLAPSDVLEALNRLLDDNRELFIPELQETIRAHPNFMLFATQNPPTLYGGRKMLSRAFRNRFLEIHVDEIPEDELSMILELRCKIPPSYASKMVEVMKELQLHRQHSKIFAGKHGFITPRDLFRWANRFRMFGMSYEDLAKDGYFLLAERLRDENEKVVVREALERHLRVKLNVDNLYMLHFHFSLPFTVYIIYAGIISVFHTTCNCCLYSLLGTFSFDLMSKKKRFMLQSSYEHMAGRLREPVLLIGETGGGKTTVCQLLSVYLKEKLHILNCHQYTETSDFIGGFYPVRDRSKMSNLFIQLIEQINASRFFNFFSREELSTDITKASSTITILNELVNTYKQNIPLHTVISQQDLKVFQQLNSDLIHLHQKWQTIFLWQDGPLVQAMKNGDLFLVDEISLADDSVLERLNSVLEPERKLVAKFTWQSLAEKGGAILEQITAHPNFFLLATMNPGGDYGKKELSPALRNRFTEIWVPPVSDMNEFRSIAQERSITLCQSYAQLLGVNAELSMTVIDMWFKFHSFLWGLCSKTNLMMKLDFEEICLVLPSRTAIIDKILQSNFSIVDYDIQCLKLSTTSRNLWQATLSQGEIVWFLHSAADSLFKQIIFVHYKYFTEDVFCKIRSFLCSAFGNSTLEDILNLKILISSSNHVGLCSVVDLLVEPILRELYMKHPSSDYLYNLGCAWLHIGMLRFYLLNQDGPDPALEFSFKHSNMLRKISLFDLETKVRQECQLLSGKDLVLYNEDQRLLTSQKLKEEEKQLRAKVFGYLMMGVVFRPSCSEYSHLRSECFDYGKLCSSLIEDLKNMGNISSMVLCNWQATSSKFINRLSEKYANYADLVQPVLVAVYEMKLGVSLVSSSALQKDYLEKVGGDDIQKIKAEVYSFMQFPRSLLYDSIPVNLKNYEQDSVSPVPLDNILHYVMLIQTTDHVLYSHILDKDCFLVLNCTFDRFAKLWIDMKTQLKAKEDEDQTFKFRTRLIKIEDIMEEEELSDNAMDFDERLLSETSKNEQEFNEMMRPVEEDKKIEEEWELIHETFSKSLPSARFVARDDRLISFLQSYKLGTRIIKDIDAFTPLSDDQLMPEYLFRVCLEYEEKFGIACKPPRAYNIYKDSNSIVLHKMTKPLGAIHKRVELFLVEWPDHPGLQNLGNIIEKLLSAPLSTPVSKALLGLQILVRKAKFLQENASMFSFKDLLDPIYSLISSWQKLELDSWKTLLDDVEEQFEINAAKFLPIVVDYIETERKSIEKDLREQLKLFSWERSHDLSIESFSRMRQKIRKLNFDSDNIGELPVRFPFQADVVSAQQLLPLHRCPFPFLGLNVAYMTLSVLLNWLKEVAYMSPTLGVVAEVLQQPLMLVVHQEAISKREKIPAWLESWTSDETNVDVLQCPLSVIKSNNVKRFFWFTSWMDKANMLTKNDILCAQGLSDVKHTLTSPTSFNELEKSWEESWFSIENISRKAAQFAHIWRHGTKNLTKRRMLGNLLKVLEKSGLSRHRHISDEVTFMPCLSMPLTVCLLIDLFAYVQLGISMYSHPSYNVLHLLLLGDLHKSSRNISTSNQVQSDNRGDDIFGFKLKSTNITSQDNKGDDIIGSKWKFANELYFKNLAVMNQLQEVCLNFSKDFSKEQVDQTNSFLCQLVFIQQEQRDAMYSAYEHLKKLQLKLRWMNAGEQSEDLTIAMNQSALLMLMWKQKNVFDSLLAMSRETNMLLGSFKSCHLDTCKVIEDEVDRIYSVIDMFLPRFSKSKESLDMYLLCNDSIVSAATELPFLITKKMEDLVISNSEIINAFEESILVFSFDKAFPRSIGGTLLSRFEQIIPKGKMKVLISQIDKDKQCATRENSMNLETFYTESYERTIKLLLDVYDKLYTNSVYNIPVHDLSGQIALWNQLFQSHKKVLRLEEIDDAFGETISAARKFVDSFSDRKDEVCSQMQIQLKHLYVLLDLILTFGDGILFEFLDVHAAVAELTNVLAHIFILIFSKGFGSSQEETENSKCNGTEDASGTGMGEGEGVNDVSDQIEDEAQLLGTSEKHDGQDELEKQPNGNDKGIEMEEDFDGETFSVSEDSEDDDLEDEEDPNLDSQMGQTAEGDQKVDEKQWDGDEDDNTENRSEKYEPGPAVKEKDSGSRELTAKDDNALAADDLEDIDKNQDDRLNEEDNDSKKNEDDFNSDDMVVDKSKAFEDPTDIQIEEEAKQTEDADMDEPQGSDMDESELGSFGSDEEMNDVDDKSKEDNVVDEDVSQVDNNSRIEVEEKAETANMEPESNKETLPSDTTETFEYPLEGKESIKSSGNSHRIESLMVSDMLAADNNDINSSIAPSRSLLSDEMSKIEIASNSVDNSKISYDQFQLKPENSQDSCSRTRPNPYRSLGDAMEDWKERAKVSVDPLESLPELVENLANEDAEEYEFVADAEKSTSQALAAATSDQINNNLDNSKSSADENHRRKNEDTNQNRVKENSDTSYLNPRQDLVSKKKDDELPYMDIGNDSLMTEMGQISNLNNQYESVVSFKSSYMNEKELLLNTSTDDKAFSNSLGIEDMPEGLLQDTVLEWKKYEVSTTRLSQVLAEQLRLVMEPTLASKLQGDYKTGKRINMKKVIPYIASHFRKDKIWLRRTKPNKRNYQVVVAVDDSRSMSESNCGNAAIEALITVCRAMSQLEVGQFAVASFGRKGNVRLLHDFDEPFTGEAGVKIMSNLSFKQDNAIVDEPLADLLKYLNNMLDNAVFRARMPSGQTPLNQLVLIIADGRIHEKENLKRYVRDALNKKRLIALILLDSPEESIIDLMEASYEGDCLSFKKYLNTFPFPYYIIHRNIEALPQTLADLLRQETTMELAESSSQLLLEAVLSEASSAALEHIAEKRPPGVCPLCSGRIRSRHRLADLDEDSDSDNQPLTHKSRHRPVDPNLASGPSSTTQSSRSTRITAEFSGPSTTPAPSENPMGASRGTPSVTPERTAEESQSTPQTHTSSPLPASAAPLTRNEEAGPSEPITETP
ncbi:hypothetical protein ZIOFF_044033 [Zingiber officinale]|uniref:Midasin n=1 Tax=Zingiber officinale TaxID=94328 RepID=A0A8J5FWH6_ZINOF|nr:hypothetical protein ZIOFF_044033 [Zingiber officinale]